MNRLLSNDSESSSSSVEDEIIEPTLLLPLHTTTTPMHPQEGLSPPSQQQQRPPATNHDHPRTVHTAVVSFNDHVEIQHYDPLPDYNDDSDSGSGGFFHFYDASDRTWIQDDSETDEDDSSSHRNNHDVHMMYAHNHLIRDNYDNDISTSTDHFDLFGLPMVDTTTSLYASSSRGRSRPLHHPMNENLQGYTDLTDFATLTDSSNSDTDSSHGSLLSHGLLVPLPQQSRRHSNLAEQLLLSSSNVPPCIIVDEYDVSSSSSGSVVSDLQHQHFIDPNLYPLQQQQQYRVGNDDDDDHINPEYYFEVQSLDSCFLPRIHPSSPYNNNNNNSNDGVDDSTNQRHPHYRLSILKQRLRDSVMALPLSLTRFRRDSISSSREETEVEVSSSNDNHHNDIFVHAEPILLP